jgi:hypothetical protein
LKFLLENYEMDTFHDKHFLLKWTLTFALLNCVY